MHRKVPFRLGWRAKAIIPVTVVLLAGLGHFVAVTWSVQGPERDSIRLVASIGAVGICAVVAVVMAVLVHSPLVELGRKIQRVRDGDLDVTVDFSSRDDDIGDLGRNFNQMVRQLRESREELERLHSTQMSRAEHFATLGELAAGLAHEIRNPLAGIAGVMSIVRRDLPPSSPAHEVVGDVQKEVQHINAFVTDLLNLARPRAPEFRPADLNATVEHACGIARQQAVSRGLELQVERSPGLPPIEHDVRQINEVCLNLVLNAIQSTARGGRVRVRLGRENGTALIQVEDTGRGIAPEHLEHIFRPFFTTRPEGTGLGLSLARRITEEHGGTVTVDSVPGEGTTFAVRLPLERRPILREEEQWETIGS